MDHSRFAPSSADRWVTCTASVGFEAQYPEAEPSKHAIEGKLADSVVEAMLTGKPYPDGYDDDMIYGATLMVQALAPLYAKGLKVEVQKTIRIDAVHPDCFGTPDAFAVDYQNKTVHVLDYKYGHRYVDPTSYQLAAYSAGCVQPEEWKAGWCSELTIVQPRWFGTDGQIRSVVLSGEEMAKRIAKLAHATFEANTNPQTRPSPSACRDCKARHACPALQEAASVAIETANYPSPVNMDGKAMSRELATLMDAQELLEARIDGLSNELTHKLKRGEPSYGFALEQGSGRMKWSVKPDEIYALGQMLGKDVCGIGYIKTPAQAIKLGIPEAVVAAYAERIPGEVKLVRDNGVRARMAFSKETK